MNDSHMQLFLEEAQELLAELENQLLELEEAPDDKELIGSIFRAMHTIKGSGAMFGFDDIAAFTHEVESVYDKVRDGQIPVTKELINLTLRARDRIKLMLDGLPEGDLGEGSTPSEIIAGLKGLTPAGDAPSPSPDGKPTGKGGPGIGISHDEVTYRIRFIPYLDIFLKGTNPLLLLNELRLLGECNARAQLDKIPPLKDIDPEKCYTSWDIILTTDRGIDAVKDVFIFVEDGCGLTIDTIDTGSPEDRSPGYKKLGEILVERGDIGKAELDKVLTEKKYLGEMLLEKGATTADKVESALIEQEHVRKVREKSRASEESAASIRVPAEKLDKLVDLVGELVTIQAHLTEKSANGNDQELLVISEEIERLSAELRDNTLSIRMLPIGTTFSRFKRLVRDLSKELGKEINLLTEGAETELDKTVIDRLNDPLVHIIRNSIDHGIEPPSVREALGKPRAGMLMLSAKHVGGQVMIDITDDGQGLDKEAIRRKAVEKGLISPDAELSEKELFSLIFTAGFSTSTAVTNLSGRGVGMDVVRKAIDALRGSVEISSEAGTGTSVTLKIPLTLAIIEGLLVEIGRQYFILPLAMVKECVELTRHDAKQAHGQHIANVRGEIVPYVRIREKFNIDGGTPDIEQIVIADIQKARIGLVVDNVIGEHQTVIKSLGKVHRNIKGISGSTILGDGAIALILDPIGLVETAHSFQVITGG